MAEKRLLFREQAREKILRGTRALADAVRVTLGPRAKCVLLQKKYGRPLACNDGVTIAREVELADPEENLGVQMLREAAEKTGEAVGDGTTTATLLAQEIYADAVRNLAAGASGTELRRGLDRGVRAAVRAIRALSKPVQSRREKAQVAAISAHNDCALGELVADAMEKVGRDGVVSVEEARGIETTLEIVEGMQFDRGFLSPYFVTDTEKMQVVLEDAVILLAEKKISSIKDLLPVLEKFVQSQQSVLIIAEDVEGEALATLVVNRLRGILRCAAVKSPGYGDRRKALMQDLAILTGGRFLAEELGVRLENLQPEDFGRAKKVVIDRETTTIIGGAGNREAIAGRCDELRRQIETATSDYDMEKLEERLARLAGGVALLKIGALSEAELKNRKEALNDTISTTRAAMAEGIVLGGGLTLIRAMSAVEHEEATCGGDELTGLRILGKALEAPARQIAENSAHDPGVIVNRMRDTERTTGFDAATGTWVDLVQTGIIDPTKVVRLALGNATSVAGILLLSEATLTEQPEVNEPIARQALKHSEYEE
ncbi:MAG: chaperonin GroEL [Planctomycetaceae bacterium]